MTGVHAYVLVQTEVGRSAAVAKLMAEIPGVTAADDVTGPYDVIAHVNASDMEALGRDVISPLQEISGITRTLTCPVVTLA
ncbi:MAG: Lrp/AsnC ligand binding domain-containing protein [Actinobacteria bacterium]|nr:Lrp/AsnC ligand binding domain-containing protein [Actinomycetota bacterium]MCB9412894.1 Lrp/AsnC ligand binding domain-containing protein [Actinomycetota bacterium]